MGKETKQFHKWLKKKWSWVNERPDFPYYKKGEVCPRCGKIRGVNDDTSCFHSIYRASDIQVGELKKRKNLSDALTNALLADVVTIELSKDTNRDWYWAWLNLEDFRREQK